MDGGCRTQALEWDPFPWGHHFQSPVPCGGDFLATLGVISVQGHPQRKRSWLKPELEVVLVWSGSEDAQAELSVRALVKFRWEELSMHYVLGSQYVLFSFLTALFPSE